jgi:lipopolysaccharide export system permease protein
MRWTLGRYFLRRYLGITFWFFLGLSLLIFIVNFTETTRRMGDMDGFALSIGLSFAALQTPLIMQQAVPFIALIAGIATLVSLNRKYELVVARAAGISAWQFLAPVCLGAFLVGLATILVLNPLAAYGLSQTSLIEAGIRGSSDDTGGGDTVWIKQRTAQGETYIGAEAVLEGGELLANAVFLTIGENGVVRERIDAATARLADGRWDLEGASVLGSDTLPERIDAVSVPTNLTPEFVGERLADPESVPFFELPRKIAAARSFGLGAHGFATQFHSLASLPLLLVAMTLIAATVSMRFARMGQSSSIILGGIVAGFLLYVVTVLVKAFGSAGIVPPAAAAWFPVIAASFFGVTFLLYKEDG